MIVNAVMRSAGVSASSSVRPSGVTAMPLGNHTSSATTRARPERVDEHEHRGTALLPRGVVVAEAADVRVAAPVDEHVVGVAVDERREIGDLLEPATGGPA